MPRKNGTEFWILLLLVSPNHPSQRNWFKEDIWSDCRHDENRDLFAWWVILFIMHRTVIMFAGAGICTSALCHDWTPVRWKTASRAHARTSVNNCFTFGLLSQKREIDLLTRRIFLFLFCLFVVVVVVCIIIIAVVVISRNSLPPSSITPL